MLTAKEARALTRQGKDALLEESWRRGSALAAHFLAGMEDRIRAEAARGRNEVSFDIDTYDKVAREELVDAVRSALQPSGYRVYKYERYMGDMAFPDIQMVVTWSRWGWLAQLLS